jgi:hypothetical protein
MNKPIKIGLAALACGIALVGCHNDDNGAPPTPPPSSSATSFEGLAFSLVEDSTCNTTAPTDINDTDFAFNPDQDTADPRDLTSITTACTS